MTFIEVFWIVVYGMIAFGIILITPTVILFIIAFTLHLVGRKKNDI